MNTIATAAKRPSASVAALRLVIAAGSWGNALLILGYALALLPWLHRGTGDSGHLAVTLSAITIMFWAMLAGVRLIASIAQAAQLRLPGVARLLAGHVGVLLVLAVLMPALLLAVAGSEALPFNLAVLGIGLLAGLLFAAMPPWLMFVLMALGYLPYALKQLWSPTSPLAIEPPQALALALALLLAGNLWCGWRIARRRGFGNGWSTPLALAFGNGQSLLLANAEQVQAGAAMFSQGTPIGSNLHRQPQHALAIALGPGFGRSTARSVLGTQLPVLGVALLWLLIAQHGGSGLPVALLFAPLLALSPALAPLMRVVTVFRLPAMGLHELALLPGLPPLPAQALIVQLTRQMLLRSLPALLIMAITCTLLDAGRAFYPLLFWSYCGSLIWLHGLGLLALQQRRFRTGLWLAMVVLAVAAYASMLPSRGATVPAGLLSAWQVACLLGALVSGAAQQRLRQLPHPWLRH